MCSKEKVQGLHLCAALCYYCTFVCILLWDLFDESLCVSVQKHACVFIMPR